MAAVKRTVHHWAQERKHCTLSANKPGFVVISSCGARVEPAQHTDAYTRAVGHCANASALEHTQQRERKREESERERRELRAIAATLMAEKQIGRNKHGTTSSVGNPLCDETGCGAKSPRTDRAPGTLHHAGGRVSELPARGLTKSCKRIGNQERGDRDGPNANRNVEIRI